MGALGVFLRKARSYHTLKVLFSNHPLHIGGDEKHTPIYGGNLKNELCALCKDGEKMTFLDTFSTKHSLNRAFCARPENGGKQRALRAQRLIPSFLCGGARVMLGPRPRGMQ